MRVLRSRAGLPLLFLLLALCSYPKCDSKVVNVGGDQGWVVPGRGAYSIATRWNFTAYDYFDVLNFTWPAEQRHDVWVVANISQFNFCNQAGGTLLSTTPGFMYTLLPPNDSTLNYARDHPLLFASFVGNDCKDGLRWWPTPGTRSPPPTNVPPTPPSPLGLPPSLPAPPPRPGAPRVINVGGDAGWVVPYSDSLSAVWYINNMYYGNVLNFTWPSGQHHDVWLLADAELLDGCDFSGASLLSNRSGLLFPMPVPLQSGLFLNFTPWYFASGVGKDCEHGLKWQASPLLPPPPGLPPPRPQARPPPRPNARPPPDNTSSAPLPTIPPVVPEPQGGPSPADAPPPAEDRRPRTPPPPPKSAGTAFSMSYGLRLPLAFLGGLCACVLTHL